MGASSVKAEWEKDIAAQKELWDKKSKEYQKQLAVKTAQVNAKRKEVQDAIRNSYPACVAGDDIVGLWQDSFGAYPR